MIVSFSSSLIVALYVIVLLFWEVVVGGLLITSVRLEATVLPPLVSNFTVWLIIDGVFIKSPSVEADPRIEAQEQKHRTNDNSIAPKILVNFFIFFLTNNFCIFMIQTHV